MSIEELTKGISVDYILHFEGGQAERALDIEYTINTLRFFSETFKALNKMVNPYQSLVVRLNRLRLAQYR